MGTRPRTIKCGSGEPHPPHQWQPGWAVAHCPGCGAGAAAPPPPATPCTPPLPMEGVQ